jgi:ADP-dependent NAD(P)H-hydrate dehydratase
MSGAKWQTLAARTLRAWPLPAVDSDADKEERGRVLVIGGVRELAGAVQLAGIAALRAGAGKLVIATAASAAAHVVQAVPEARVIALAENADGSLCADVPEGLASSLQSAAAVLVGPGLTQAPSHVELAAHVLDACADAPVVFDAGAMDTARRVGRFGRPVLLTPHPGEMAHLLALDKSDVLAQPERHVLDAARRWNAVVALKGAVTLVATPQGEGWRHEGGHPGLATSGSGDVLSGLVAGIAARGAGLAQACAWAVVLHKLAGRMLAREIGPFGYLARELPGPVPRLLRRLQR